MWRLRLRRSAGVETGADDRRPAVRAMIAFSRRRALATEPETAAPDAPAEVVETGADADRPMRFLGFLAGVVGDWGTTLRLAFLLGTASAAVGALLLFVQLNAAQWVYVVTGALGIGGVAKFRQWWESRDRNPPP